MHTDTNNYENAVIRAAMELYKVATHNNPNSECYGEITPSEDELIIAYLGAKGLPINKRKGIKHLFTDPNCRNLILEDLCLIENLDEYKVHLAENQVPFEVIVKFAKIAFKDNLRLDPEELKLLETMLELEDYATPRKLDKFYELTKKYNTHRKINLMINEPVEIEEYKEEFEKAGYHISAYRETDDKKLVLEDYNSQGNMNLIVFSPYTYPEERRNTFIARFKQAKRKNLNLPPVLAIDCHNEDTPAKLGVDRVLRMQSDMKAIVENIDELYYLRYTQNGR